MLLGLWTLLLLKPHRCILFDYIQFDNVISINNNKNTDFRMPLLWNEFQIQNLKLCDWLTSHPEVLSSLSLHKNISFFREAHPAKFQEKDHMTTALPLSILINTTKSCPFAFVFCRHLCIWMQANRKIDQKQNKKKTKAPHN